MNNQTKPQYLIQNNKKYYGPCTLEELKKIIAENKLGIWNNDLAIRIEEKDWKEIVDFNELNELITEIDPPPNTYLDINM